MKNDTHRQGGKASVQGHHSFKGDNEGDEWNMQEKKETRAGRSARATMPEERKDTKPTIQEEDAKVSSDGLGDGGEISAAADQLAAVTLADDGEAGPAGPGTSETPRDSVDQRSLLADTAMIDGLLAADLCVGWYGHDIAFSTTNDQSLKAGTSDDPELWKPQDGGLSSVFCPTTSRIREVDIQVLLRQIGL